MAVPLMAGYGVVIPAFNAAATIAETLDSVMAQTVRAEAVIVVDDGSTGRYRCRDQRDELPVTVLRQDNAGPGSATTKGFAALSTPFGGQRSRADDLWLPDKDRKRSSIS